MALWRCLGCSTAYAVGLSGCPHCHSTDRIEQGQPMPKITRHGGASTADEEVASSPGNSSSTSPQKQQPSETPSKAAPRKPAPTTGSRSSKTRKGDPAAGSTAGRPTADN